MVGHYGYRFDCRRKRLEVGTHFAKYGNGAQRKTKKPWSDAEKADQANLPKKRNPRPFVRDQI